jgi:hypothetical protein
VDARQARFSISNGQLQERRIQPGRVHRRQAEGVFGGVAEESVIAEIVFLGDKMCLPCSFHAGVEAVLPIAGGEADGDANEFIQFKRQQDFQRRAGCQCGLRDDDICARRQAADNATNFIRREERFGLGDDAALLIGGKPARRARRGNDMAAVMEDSSRHQDR